MIRLSRPGGGAGAWRAVSRRERSTEPTQLSGRQIERRPRWALFEPGSARVRRVHENAERDLTGEGERATRDISPRKTAPTNQPYKSKGGSEDPPVDSRSGGSSSASASRSRRLSTRCSRLPNAGAARSEIVGKRRTRRAAPVSPVTLRPSSRRLSLALQLTMIRHVARVSRITRGAPGRASDSAGEDRPECLDAS